MANDWECPEDAICVDEPRCMYCGRLCDKTEVVYTGNEESYAGFARVVIDHKYNYINSDYKLISDTWFDRCGDFHDGFAEVRLNDKYYHLRKDGVLCDYNTKEPVEPDHSASDIDYKKKYEEALQRARVVNPGTADHNIVTTIFPELKDSTDEKMIRNIIEFLRMFSPCEMTRDGTTIGEILAWLGKFKGCKAGVSDQPLSDEEMKELLQTEYEKGRHDGLYDRSQEEVEKWKLTEEQMHVLYNSILCCMDIEDIPILDTLYRDLKKLQGNNMRKTGKQFLKAVEEAKQRLAAGEKPKDVFDYCGDFNEGFARVKLNDKRNYIDRNGNLLSDVWFDWGGNFHNKFAPIERDGKYNFIDSNGNILSYTWFDRYGNFNEGFACVELKGKWNFIGHEGKYLSDTWFEDCWNFWEGFAYVKLNGRRYLLRKDGVLCDYVTKEPIKMEE